MDLLQMSLNFCIILIIINIYIYIKRSRIQDRLKCSLNNFMKNALSCKRVKKFNFLKDLLKSPKDQKKPPNPGLFFTFGNILQAYIIIKV